MLSLLEITNPNDLMVIQCLQHEGELTRQEIHYRTGIPRTTVQDALQRLVRQYIVTVESEPRVTRGRPRRLWRLIA